MTKPPPPVEAAPAPASRRALWFAAAALNILVLSMAGLELRESLGQYRERARIETGNLARLVELDLSETFDKIDLLLAETADEIGRRLETAPANDPSIRDYLSKRRSMMSELGTLRMTDAIGTIVNGIGVGADARANLGDRDYFIRQRDHSDSGLVVSKLLVTRIDRKWSIVASRRIAGPDGAFAGIVYALITTDQFTGKFKGLKLKNRGAVTLLDSDYALMMRYPVPADFDAIVGQSKPTRELKSFGERGLTEGDYTARSPVDGLTRMFSMRRIAQPPFFVIVSVVFDDVLAEWEKHSAVIVMLALALCLATLVSARLISQGWKRQESAYQALDRARSRLEERVAERTAELREKVRELRAANELAVSARRMKMDFLANVSHELKTPLNPVIAFTDLTLASDLTPDARENLIQVRSAAEKLREMIENLIGLTSLDSITVENSPVGTKSLLDMLLQVLREPAREKGLDLTGLMDVDVPDTIETDLNLVRLALLKIGENAIKFTDKGGVRLEIEPGVGGREGSEVCIKIGDTGIGIAADKIAAVTSGLNQADAPLTKHYRGLGLGLATARKALELLGGRLVVVSQPGLGSTFTVCLPRVPKEERS